MLMHAHHKGNTHENSSRFVHSRIDSKRVMPTRPRRRYGQVPGAVYSAKSAGDETNHESQLTRASCGDVVRARSQSWELLGSAAGPKLGRYSFSRRISDHAR